MQHSPGEAGFHAFYQMLAGIDMTERARLGLRSLNGAHQPDGAPAHAYLTPRTPLTEQRTVGGAAARAGVCRVAAGVSSRDAVAWNATCAAATIVGILPSELRGVTEVLASILHLGDVRFVEIDCLARLAPATDAAAQHAATLLRVPREGLASALTTRTLSVHGHTDIECGRTGAQARASCDALAKRLYAMLFTWLVGRVNERVAPECADDAGTSAAVIAILDLFGFESLATNSLEQMVSVIDMRPQSHGPRRRATTPTPPRASCELSAPLCALGRRS